jgi:cullin-associated NEDD8-dissociated protein 1
MFVDFIPLMVDRSLVSALFRFFSGLWSSLSLDRKRLSLSALNSAARTNAYLTRDHLQILLPTLYQETVVKPELIRTVQMGPQTHKVDDGLEARNTVYETLYALVGTISFL